MRRLLLLLGFLSAATVLFGWTGSNQKVQLLYPKGSGQITRMYLPCAVYGIVANDLSEVDYHTVQIYDTVLADTVFVDTVQDHNLLAHSRLLSGVLIKRGKNSIIFKRQYRVTLRAWDVNGDSYADTALVYFLPRGDEQ